MRALLALLVLLGTLPFQLGVGASGGRADSGGIELHLEANGAGPHALGLTGPTVNDSVILGKNESAEFTIANFTALRLSATGPEFHLNLSLVSLNISGMRISCSLFLDPRGNGSAFQVAFDNYTSAVAVLTEHASLAAFAPNGDPAGLDFLNGTMSLRIARTDDTDGLLEVLCGNGENASLLSVPYGAPLVADAGPDREARTNSTVPFNASLSRSVDPASTKYYWDLGNGDNYTGAEATAIYNRSGEYTVRLTLSCLGFSANDSLTVNVTDNIPPVAYAGQNTTKRINETFTFRGSGTDADGWITSYFWDFGDGFTSNIQNATHAFTSPGDYAVVLTVQDNEGATGTHTIRVHVNQPLEVTSITASKVGHAVNFQISVSNPDGNQLTYFWDFGDGSNGSGSMTSHTYNRTGSFNASCLVTDTYGDNATASVVLNFTNSPPQVLSLGISSQNVVEGDTVGFNPSVSDADGDTLSYRWNFGDGSSNVLRTPVHVYKNAGTYTVTLTVSDGIDNGTKTAKMTVASSSAAVPDTTTAGLLVCAAVFGVILIIVLVRIIARRPNPSYAPYQPYGGMPPYQYPPPTVPPAPLPYGAPYGYPYGGPAGGTPPPSPPRPPPVRAAPGVCPRCGSTDVQLFPDGHSKCANCKKIFFTG
jgi:PKD repeat protein